MIIIPNISEKKWLIQIKICCLCIKQDLFINNVQVFWNNVNEMVIFFNPSLAYDVWLSHRSHGDWILLWCFMDIWKVINSDRLIDIMSSVDWLYTSDWRDGHFRLNLRGFLQLELSKIGSSVRQAADTFNIFAGISLLVLAQWFFLIKILQEVIYKFLWKILFRCKATLCVIMTKCFDYLTIDKKLLELVI